MLMWCPYFKNWSSTHTESSPDYHQGGMGGAGGEGAFCIKGSCIMQLHAGWPLFLQMLYGSTFGARCCGMSVRSHCLLMLQMLIVVQHQGYLASPDLCRSCLLLQSSSLPEHVFVSSETLYIQANWDAGCHTVSDGNHFCWLHVSRMCR